MSFEYYYYTGIEFVIVRDKDGVIIFDGPSEDWFDDED